MDAEVRIPMQVTLEAVRLPAVPCNRHRTWTMGCPDCLTGEQAWHLGVKPRKFRHWFLTLWR